MVGAVQEHAENGEVDRGEQHNQKDVFTQPAKQFRFSEIFAQILKSEQMNVTVAAKKEGADKDHHQSTEKERPEREVDGCAEVGVLDVPDGVGQHVCKQEGGSDRYNHPTDQGDAAAADTKEEVLDHVKLSHETLLLIVENADSLLIQWVEKLKN